MASGDKLYIADKATLDITRSNTDNIKASVSDLRTASVKSNTDLETLKSNTTTILESTSDIRSDTLSLRSAVSSLVGNKDPLTPMTIDSLNKTYYRATAVSGNSLTNVLHHTGSGVLYMAVIGNVPQYTTGLRINIDGNTILDSSFAISASAPIYTGLVTSACVLGANSATLMLVGGISVNVGYYATMAPLSREKSSTHYYSMRPIRWNNSITISGLCNGSSALIYLYYELD